MPTRCNTGFYCRSYCLLNMFRASLCPTSGAQEYYTVVAACGILCCKDVKNNFVSFVEFVFSVLSVVCYLGLLLGVSNVVGAVCLVFLVGFL